MSGVPEYESNTFVPKAGQASPVAAPSHVGNIPVSEVEVVEPNLPESGLAPRGASKRDRFLQLHKVAREGCDAYITAGLALVEIRDDELWRDGGFPSWDAYCRSFLNTSRSYAARLIKSAIIVQNLNGSKLPTNSQGEPVLPKNECQVRALAKLKSPKEQAKAWKLAIKRASGSPTTAMLTEVVRELLAENPSPQKPPAPGRKEQRVQLMSQLREAAEKRDSWDSVLSLIADLEQLS